MKGQWFVTVKVRGDAGPTFPETGLEIGVEVGYSDDVAVTARVVSLRLREQTFIPVVEMDVGIQVVLYRPSCFHAGPAARRSTATTKGYSSRSLSQESQDSTNPKAVIISGISP